MYQFSRSIYRELVSEVACERPDRIGRYRAELLRCCEATVERLASDRHYFARPARTLFNDVRELFPLASQMRVYRVIERLMDLAGE